MDASPPPTATSRPAALLRAMRPVQWTKNLLLAVPMLVGQELADPAHWLALAVALVSFCAVASSVYLVNDIRDAPADREHPVKRARPFAAGRLSPATGLIAAALLILVGFALALLLPTDYLIVLATYLVVSTVYSFWAKGKQVIDVLVLASLYTLRLIAGGEATDVPPSFWLLAFSMFIFLSLAFAKRYAELARLANDGGPARAAGRGYRTDDMSLLRVVGPVSGYLSVLVFAMYINSETVTRLYAEPRAMWLVCPLLIYWITRLWLLVGRGEVDDDPLLFALRDRGSWATALCIAVIAVAAATMG